jgi:hypothetical protein
MHTGYSFLGRNEGYNNCMAELQLQQLQGIAGFRRMMLKGGVYST